MTWRVGVAAFSTNVLWTTAIVGGTALAAACGGTTALDARDGERDARTGRDGSCWPASLDAPNAATGDCAAGSMLLSCNDSLGTGSICVANSPEICVGGLHPVAGECRNSCRPGEYAAACGSVGVSHAPPSAACRTEIPTPGGLVYYCCPCER
jgi:hypothetical protein